MKLIDKIVNIIIKKIKNTHLAFLISLVTFLFVLPFLPERIYYILFEIFYFLIVILASISTGKYFKKLISWTFLLVLIELISFLFNFNNLLLISRGASFLFLIIITILTIINIARSQKFDFLIILEAINAYLLMGIAFSFIVTMIIIAQPNAFDLLIQINNKRDFIDITYYTFTTMTTLGYGDLLPVAKFAKSTSIFITLSGQIYLTVMIGMLIGKIVSKNHN